MKWYPTGIVFRVDLSPFGKKQANQPRIPQSSCPVERCHAIAILHIHVGTVGNEQFAHLHEPCFCPITILQHVCERCPIIDIFRVNGSALGNEEFNHLHLPADCCPVERGHEITVHRAYGNSTFDFLLDSLNIPFPCCIPNIPPSRPRYQQYYSNSTQALLYHISLLCGTRVYSHRNATY